MKAYKDVLNRLQSSSAQPVELKDNETVSIIYHNIFDYPLNSEQLHRWTLDKAVLKESLSLQEKTIEKSLGFYFLEGKKSAVVKSILRREVSKKKKRIAERAARILSLAPGVYMVAVTGALAMDNADEDSDIDMMIITKKNRLWMTRIMCWLLLNVFGQRVRRPNDDFQKDKLCLNIWLDETDLEWPKEKRNIFSAHEIAQILPLVNKKNTYQKFISCNVWVKRYWKNAIDYNSAEAENQKRATREKSTYILKNISINIIDAFITHLEKAAFRLQYLYMKGKLTRETVTKSRALFHPVDWSGVVKTKMETYVR